MIGDEGIHGEYMRHKGSMSLATTPRENIGSKDRRQGRSGWEANRPNGSIIVKQPDQKKSRKEVEGKNRDSTLPDMHTWIKVEGVGTTSFHYGEQPEI